MYAELIRELTYTDSFFDSLKTIADNFSVNTVIMCLMMLFTIIGGIDKIRGNKKGYGEKFDEAFAALKPLALTMIGVITFVPILKLLLEPLVVPLYTVFGASPAMFAGTIFPVDSGAYPLALQLAAGDTAIANFSSIVLGGTLGCLFIGTIPICLSCLDKKYYNYVSMAVLLSVITMPVGAILGGVAMTGKYKLPFSTIMINLIPVILVAVLVAVGLILRPREVMRGFCAFGRAMQVILTFCIVVSTVQFVTGLRLPLFHVMVEPGADGSVSPLIDSIIITGNIALVLTGAFPMVLWLSRAFKKPIEKLSAALGMNEAGGAGLLASLASIFPALDLVPKMNRKGRLLVLTFCISGAFVFGDHLGFTAGVEQTMVLPLIISKLVAGILALLLAHIFYAKFEDKLDA